MRGYTLVELLFVIFLAGITTASVAPTARRYRDRAAAVAARETVVGLLAEARSQAMASGGATVRVSAADARAETLVNGTLVESTNLSADFGVSVSLAGGGGVADLSYDALGLGRMTSQTLVFRRGDQAAQLVISAYGRVRR